MREKGRAMTQFRMICPDCGATVLTVAPEALVWELCPSCRSHVWDAYDVLMKESSSSFPRSARSLGLHPAN
jgi:Zn-finger nucleic acid-binding protein